MANRLYDLGREKFLGKAGGPTISWGDDNIKAMLCSASYTPNTVTDEFIGNGVTPIPTAAIIARAANLALKTTSLGVADAADVVFSAVTGAAVTQFLLYKDTGADATSPLIALWDTATGLPVTPNGGDITLQWNNGADKIFKLSGAMGAIDIRLRISNSGLWLPVMEAQ